MDPSVDPNAVAAGQARVGEFMAKFGLDTSAPEYPVASGYEHAPGGAEDEYNNKRKYDDTVEGETDEGRTWKRFNGTEEGFPPQEGGDAPGLPGAPSGNTGEFSDFLDCPRQCVGKLIGRSGATIQDLQSRSGCRIQIRHELPGDLKRVDISGKSAEQVAGAKQMIQQVLDSESTAVPGEMERTVECPQGIVGRIIGKGGETIRALQASSMAHIVVDQNFPDGVARKVNISGKPEAVERAVKMVTELIEGNPGSAQTVIQKYSAGVTAVMECPKSMVGRVIGKGGETIKNLQKNSNASIQIDQTLEPCKVTISGRSDSVARAQAMIRDVIEGNDYNQGQMGGGGGGFGGPRPGFTPPFQPPYQAAAAPYNGGGYGYNAPQANPYAQANAYGGYGATQNYPQSYGGGPAAAAYGGGYNPGYGGAADPYAGSYGGGYGAGQPAGASGGSVWQELQDSEGRPYYYNTQSGVSQWEKPADMR